MNWNRIREERKKKGYTLAQVARETGYSIGYIPSWNAIKRNRPWPLCGKSRPASAVPRST